jgi:hypothetical protein
MLLAFSVKKAGKEYAAKKTTSKPQVEVGIERLRRSRDEVRGVSREVGFV